MAWTPWTLGTLDIRDQRFNIADVDGWDAFPGYIGRPVQFPFKHGSVVAGRDYFDSSRLALAVMVMPNDAAGDVTHTEGPRAHIRENLDLLMGELNPGGNGLLTVTRTEPLYPGAGTENRTILARPASIIPVRSNIGALDRFILLDFITPSPFWRKGSQKTGESNPTVTNGGNAPVDDMVITFSGGATQRLTNTTTGEWIEVAGTGTAIIVDVGLRTVTEGGSPADALIDFNQLFPHWMEFVPGANTLTLTGGGTVSIDFYDKAF